MIPDWILSLQSSATWARRYENRRSFQWDEDVVEELRNNEELKATMQLNDEEWEDWLQARKDNLTKAILEASVKANHTGNHTPHKHKIHIKSDRKSSDAF